MYPKGNLFIPAPHGRLEAIFKEPAGTRKGLGLVCHPHPLGGGTMHNKVVFRVAAGLVDAGLATLRFNFRGVGASTGTHGEIAGGVEDVRTALDHLSTTYPHEEITLAGFSFGGYVAAEAARRLPEGAKASRLVLIAPSTQKERVPAVPANTLVVHGDADDVVPLAATLDWARPQSLPVTVVPGAGHFFHGQLTLLKNIVLRAWR